MTDRNQALVREAYEAYGRGDVAGMMEFADPELEWTYLDPAFENPEPQTCHGRDQLQWALERQAGHGQQPVRPALEHCRDSFSYNREPMRPPRSSSSGPRVCSPCAEQGGRAGPDRVRADQLWNRRASARWRPRREGSGADG